MKDEKCISFDWKNLWFFITYILSTSQSRGLNPRGMSVSLTIMLQGTR